ncbi:MAG TPA: hypothetical protein VF311_13405 [Terriglobales bacterium]|jgi:hypothetical protein
MADSPFDNPEIQARIAADVARIQSTWLEWNAEPTTGDRDTKIVETLVDTLNAHARRYLEAVDGNSRLPEYNKRLRRVGSALMENAENRGLLSDPYSEDRLRKMAESTGHIISRRHELTPEKYEAEIRAEIERCRSALMSEALQWHEWKNQLVIRIETRFEARYRHWAAEGIERAQRTGKRSASNPADKSLIGKLPKAALVRMEAATAAFMAGYLPKLEREANKSGPIHDAELLRELVIHQFDLVARECMAVCASAEEFEVELYSDIARFVRYGLSQYGWLADPMLQELDTGFTFFVMRVNPWAEIPENDRASASHVGTTTGEALSHAALKLRAEAWARAAKGGFPKVDLAGDTKPGGTEPAQGQPAKVANGADGGATSWQAIEISFLSDERVQICNGASTETHNYAELGFADRRNGKPSQAWVTLRAMAEENGIIRNGAKTGVVWPKVEKRIQEIRKVLRKHFGITADPIPFVEGTGYQACFKIGCSPSFHT